MKRESNHVTNANWEVLMKETDFYHVLQPIMDLAKDKVHGYEVLLRSPSFQNPELFFNYAKEQNQLFELDMKAISKAIGTFKQKSLDLNDSYLFINIFPSTLMNPVFHFNIQKLKSASNLQPNSIVFEINEAEKVPDLKVLKESILDLEKLGFLIALDDIGKGQSSIQSILELEPDIAKVDRYFTDDLANSPKKQKVIELLLQLFGNDTTMILEGFECEADLNVAKELGVSYGQGFFLGRPEPAGHYNGSFFAG